MKLFSILAIIFFIGLCLIYINGKLAYAVTPTTLGGMNLDGYCESLNQGRASLNGSTWYCTNNTQQPTNLNTLCIWQYNLASAYAQQTRVADPYSWACFSSPPAASPSPTPIPTPLHTPIPSPSATPLPSATSTPTPIPTSTPVPTSPANPTVLGGMTLDQYCTSLGLGYSFVQNGVWDCTGNGQTINLNAACVWQYNISNAFAKEQSSGNIYTYVCYSSAVSTTPIPTPLPTIIPGDDWAIYKYNIQRSNYNPNETIINPATASQLSLKWTSNTSSAVVSDQPMVVNGVIYYGDWSGNFYAKDLSGKTLWFRNLGGMTPPAQNNCNPPSVGVVGSAAVQSISVNGVQTPIVFISGADGNMYALYASNGNILWQTHLANPNVGELMWDSPALYNGSLYIGIASLGDCPLVQGREYQLNWRSGVIQSEAKLVPDGCVGAGEWGSPTIDTATNKIYISTGTQDNSCKVNGQPYFEPNGIAIVELDLNLNILGSWRIPPNEQGEDSDFGVSPALTVVNVNGVSTKLVSVINKNGRFYTFKRDGLTAGPIVDEVLGIGGTCPDCGQGSISTPATDGTTLYQGSGSTTIKGVNYLASIRAINPATGAFIWEHGLSKALVASPSMVKGVLIVPNGNYVDVMSTTNGQELLHLTPPGANSVLDGPIAISQGQLIFGDLNGTFWDYGL